MNTDLSVLILSVCGLAVFLLIMTYFPPHTFWGVLFMVACFGVAISLYVSDARTMQRRKPDRRTREMKERIRKLKEEKKRGAKKEDT